MKKSLFFLVMISLLMITVACGMNNSVQKGYVVEVSDSSILIVSDITKEEALDFEEGKGTDATWYRVKDSSNYKAGQLLRIEHGAMAESYPRQSEALKIKIVEE